MTSAFGLNALLALGGRRLAFAASSRWLASDAASKQRICALIVGAPGSGKGTISNWIVRDFQLAHVSSGDLLRRHLNEGTQVGQQAKAYIDKGNLVPDEVR